MGFDIYTFINFVYNYTGINVFIFSSISAYDIKPYIFYINNSLFYNIYRFEILVFVYT